MNLPEGSLCDQAELNKSEHSIQGFSPEHPS